MSASWVLVDSSARNPASRPEGLGLARRRRGVLPAPPPRASRRCRPRGFGAASDRRARPITSHSRRGRSTPPCRGFSSGAAFPPRSSPTTAWRGRKGSRAGPSPRSSSTSPIRSCRSPTRRCGTCRSAESPSRCSRFGVFRGLPRLFQLAPRPGDRSRAGRRPWWSSHFSPASSSSAWAFSASISGARSTPGAGGRGSWCASRRTEARAGAEFAPSGSGSADPSPSEKRCQSVRQFPVSIDRIRSVEASPLRERFEHACSRRGSTSASVSSGNTGRASTSFAAFSDSGRSPSPYPRSAKQSWRCRGIG